MRCEVTDGKPLLGVAERWCRAPTNRLVPALSGSCLQAVGGNVGINVYTECHIVPSLTVAVAASA